MAIIGNLCGWILMAYLSTMIKATRADKDKVVALLHHSFNDNLSVQFMVGGGAGRSKRLRRLMTYSFELCYRYGEIWLSEHKDGCALILYPHLKTVSFQTIWLDIQLLFGVIRFSGLKKVLRRERLIAAQHPASPFCYLWFIGVNPQAQGRGIGSELLIEILTDTKSSGIPVYLETSVPKNVEWYRKLGFQVFHELDMGYPLFFLKREWRNLKQ